MTFLDRTEAGRILAQRLTREAFTAPIVLGLARGGVVVAAEVAAALGAPLEVFVARKIGAPGHEELGIGAVAEGRAPPVVSDAARKLGLSEEGVAALAGRARQELARQLALYRGDRPLPELGGRDVIVVDDGLATGVTAEAALRGVRAGAPHRLVLAVPVCAPETARRMGELADQVVCAERPYAFYAVGQWYEQFPPVSDQEVLDCLAAARAGFRRCP